MQQKTSLPVAVFLMLAVCAPCPAKLSEGCRDAVAHLLSRRQEPLQENRVTFMAYPGHIEIAVDGQVFRSDNGFRARALTIEDAKTFSRKGHSPLVTVDFRVTQSELDRLKLFLAEDKRRVQTCVSGACRAINTNMAFTIPHLIRWSPEGALMYLAAIKAARLDHGRISKVELHSAKPWTALPHYLASGISTHGIVSLLGLPVAGIFLDDEEEEADPIGTLRPGETEIVADSILVEKAEPKKWFTTDTNDKLIDLKIKGKEKSPEGDRDIDIVIDVPIFYDRDVGQDRGRGGFVLYQDKGKVFAQRIFPTSTAKYPIVEVGKVLEGGRFEPASGVSLHPYYYRRKANFLRKKLGTDHDYESGKLRIAVSGLDSKID